MTLGHVDGGKHSRGRRAEQQEPSAGSRMHQSQQVSKKIKEKEKDRMSQM